MHILRNFQTFLASVNAARRKNDAAPTLDARFLGTYQDGIAWDVPERLKQPSILTADHVLRQHNKADWSYVDPDLQEFAARLIEALRRRGIPFYVHSAYRTHEEQLKLVARKVSKTRPPKAAHCQGKAVDLVHSTFHWDLTRKEWSLIGILGREVLRKMNEKRPKERKLLLTWGGDWSFYDPAHWEITSWRDDIRPEFPHIEPTRKTPRNILRTQGR